jgi:hypothetical protein
MDILQLPFEAGQRLDAWKVSFVPRHVEKNSSETDFICVVNDKRFYCCAMAMAIPTAL